MKKKTIVILFERNKNYPPPPQGFQPLELCFWSLSFKLAGIILFILYISLYRFLNVMNTMTPVKTSRGWEDFETGECGICLLSLVSVLLRILTSEKNYYVTVTCYSAPTRPHHWHGGSGTGGDGLLQKRMVRNTNTGDTDTMCEILE